jgi:hypothetical protein
MNPDLNLTPGKGEPAVEPVFGGGHAAQAFRLQQAREGVLTPAAAHATVAAALGKGATNLSPDARAAERKIVNGRARLSANGAPSVTGKLVDISLTGACILMEEMPAVKKIGTLDCDIFHNGQRYLLQVQALCVYGVLAGNRGFKVGYQFGPRSHEAEKTLAALLA